MKTLSTFLATLAIIFLISLGSQRPRNNPKTSLVVNESDPQKQIQPIQKRDYAYSGGIVILAEESENGHWFWQSDWPQLIFWGALIFIGGGALARKGKK